MTNRLGVLFLVVACGGSPGMQVGGRVTRETIEGGFWSIRGDDGVTYDPRSLPGEVQKDGLAVFATLAVRHDMASTHMVGPVVDVLRIAPVPGFCGAWKGVKSYLNADGSVAGWTPDWVFQIRMTSEDSARFVNGPQAKITADTLTVSPYAYPPAYPPGPQGHCVPIMDAITGGTGTLAADGTLSLTLNWTHSCGGRTASSVTAYSMSPVAALQSYEIPGL
jgi:hypothetical protein